MGSGVYVKTKGSYKETMDFLKRCAEPTKYSALASAGENGVNALSASTPVDSGITADSWFFKIRNTGSGRAVEWGNSNVNEGYNIAVLLQIGHGTGTGGYYPGIDYINPALQPIFDETADVIWKEVIG